MNASAIFTTVFLFMSVIVGLVGSYTNNSMLLQVYVFGQVSLFVD
jgi:hypothetical protein